ETWTAGDSPKKFGRAQTKPPSSSTAIIRLTQSGYRFIDFGRTVKGKPRRAARRSRERRSGRARSLRYALQRSLGQRHLDGGLLHGDLDVRRDLQIAVLIPDLGDASQRSARGDHFVALGEPRHHLLLLFRAFHLRTDHQEEDRGEDDEREQDAIEGPRGVEQPPAARRALRIGLTNQHVPSPRRFIRAVTALEPPGLRRAGFPVVPIRSAGV